MKMIIEQYWNSEPKKIHLSVKWDNLGGWKSVKDFCTHHVLQTRDALGITKDGVFKFRLMEYQGTELIQTVRFSQ